MSMRWQTFLGVDDSQAAGVLANPYYFGVSEFDAPPATTWNKADVAIGDRTHRRMVATMKDLQGRLAYEADPETLLRVLSWAIGAGVATPLAIGTQTSWAFQPKHTGTILQSFYAREYKAVTGETNGLLYGPCYFNTLQLEATAGEKLQVSADWAAADPAVIAAGVHPAESFPDLELKPFIFKDLAFKQDDFAAYPPTTPDTTVERFMLNINNNLVLDKRTSNGSFYPADPLPVGKVEITGELEMEFASSSLYDKFMAQTYQMLQAKFTGDLMLGGTNSYDLQLDLPRVRLTGHNRGGPIGGGVAERLKAVIPFEALYDTTEATTLLATLQNLTTAI